MRVIAILPVKLSSQKTRLAGELSEKEREELVICMLKDVLDSLSSVDDIVLVGPKELRQMLEGYDFELIVEEGRGLNNAVRLGNKHAMARGADATLFIPVDTPLLEERHIIDILHLGKEHQVVISPSRREGTGILFRRPPDVMRGRFTKTSFLDHKREAENKGVEMFVYDSFSLSLDIDTPEDLRDFLACESHTRTHEFLSRLKVRF
ncbi:MAG: 2-phospho-L-lactate guanylyltransferase [Candidatus Hydrothermarchaeales archaeon]